LREGGQPLLAVGLGLAVLGGHQLALDTQLLLGLVHATGGGLVEGVVVTAADVERQADALSAAAGLGRGLTTGGESECESRGADARDGDSGYPAHEGPLHSKRLHWRCLSRAS